MCAQPMKFKFDLDLGRQNEKTSVLTETTLNRRLEEARQAGYNQGFAEGENSTAAQAARQLALAAQDLAAHVASMTASLDDQRKIDLADAIDLAAAVGRKLAATAISQHPEAEIATLVAECMATIDNVPHLVIRCAPDLADAVRDDAQGHMATTGFTGRLVVLGDPDIPAGDARIEWADGGVARSGTHLVAQIDATIAAYFAAHGVTPASRPALADLQPETPAPAVTVPADLTAETPWPDENASTAPAESEPEPGFEPEPDAEMADAAPTTKTPEEPSA